jgi:hypothetical protein
MTNYYAKFDENGTQQQLRLGLDEENPTGWFDTGKSSIENTFFKLVNGQVAELSSQEVVEMYKGLSYNSGLEKAREQRNSLLFYSDWTQGPDVALSLEEKQAWAEYRQLLRDLPDTVDEFGGFTLPTPPNPNYNPLGL